MTRKQRKLNRFISLIVVCIFTAVLLFPFPVFAAPGDPLTVTDMNSLTPEQLVAALLGDGVTVENIQFSAGDDSAAGTFSGDAAILGLESGIVLGTGDINESVPGPNDEDDVTEAFYSPGDSDLDRIIQEELDDLEASTEDATILEFDFVPQTDRLTFQYVFASDEYNEYANTEFNDVFAFFLNEANVALVPGTNDRVCINNINEGNPYGDPTPHNSQYYRNNRPIDEDPPFNTEMDGLTTVLTIDAAVNAGVTNHIKLAIGDAGDSAYDSNVFISNFKSVPPPRLQFSQADYTVNEDAGSVDITVTRTGDRDVAASVDYSTSNGTATADSDYTAVSGTLTFEAGETSKTFSVPIQDDSQVEGDETVNLTLSNPSGAPLGTPDTAVLTIIENDASSTIQFSAANYTVEENAGNGVITVTRDGGTSLAASADYSTSDGTAKAGSDYTSVTGTVYFDSGVTSKTFTVPILNDSKNESNETVNLALSSPSGATLGSRDTAVLTIIDNDSSGGGSSGGGGGRTVRTVTTEQPPTGLTLIDRMPGYIKIGEPVKIDELRQEIVLEYNQALLDSNPKHAPRVYYWNTQAGKWVALASYSAGDGKMKAINDGKYKGWFNVFGVIQPVFSDIKANHWAEQVINRMNGLGMIEGYPGANGGMTRLAKVDQSISRVEYTVLLSRILNMDPDAPMLEAMSRNQAEALLQSKYSDGDTVPDWAVEAVGAVAEEGLIVDRNGKLEAAAPITRIEAAVMVSKALKTIPGYEYKAADLSGFADGAQIPAWANGEVAENVIYGYPDGTLKPNGEITRAESLALLLRLFVQGLGW